MKGWARLALVTLHILVVLLILRVGTAPAQGKGNKGKVSYTFTTIEPPGSTLADARGINDSGQIAGSFIGAGGSGPHGFLFDGASFTTFDVPGGFPSSTLAFGINGTGQIVGSFQDTAGQHGYLKDGSIFTTIHVAGADFTEAFGINTARQIVGIFGGCPGVTCNHGFLFDGTTFTSIDVPGAANGAFTLPWGINDRGQIVGWFADSNLKEHGFLLDGGTFTIFDFPGAVVTEPHGIDACGRIVGSFVDVSNVVHGFLLKHGMTFTVIDVPGALATHANSISETTGQIVGDFRDASGTTHGYLATPTRRHHCPGGGWDDEADEQ